MSTIKCPMCGKPNPAEAEVCKYCQARLKPLVAPTPKKSEDEVDWLRGLAGKDSQPTPESPDAAPEQNPEEEPDWLARIRLKTKDEQDAVSPIGRPPKVELPSTGSPFSAPDTSKPVQPAQPGGEDWLQSLRGAKMADEPPSGPQNEPPLASASSEEMDNDEWLSSLNSRLGSSQPYAPYSSTSDAEHLQNILTGQAGAPRPSQNSSSGKPPVPILPDEELLGKAEQPEADTPDWLKNYGANKAQPASPAPAVPEPTTDLTEWLKSLSSSEAPEAPAPLPPAARQSEAAPADVPDWLKAFGSEGSTAAAPTQPAGPPSAPAAAQSEPAPADIPDWLKAFAPAEPPQAAAPTQPVIPPAAPQSEASPADVPDWLKSFGVEEPQGTSPTQPVTTSAVPAAAQSEAFPADIPDWLKSFSVETPPAAESTQPVTPPAVPAASQAEAAPADVPDWLKSFSVETPPAAESTQPVTPLAVPAAPQAEAAPADVPDWLKSFGAEEPQAAVPTQPVTPPAVPAAPQAEATPAEGIPDWLKAFAPPSLPAVEVPPASAEESAPDQAVSAEGIPDWLKDFTTRPAAADERTAPEPAPLGAPGGGTAFVDSSPEAAAPVPEAGAVKAGEIPDWLKSYSQQESQPSQPEPEPASAALPAYVSPFGDANLSEWMHADQSAQEAEQPESGERSLFALGSGSSEPSAPALSFAGNEVNEWLGTSAEEQGVIDEAVANARQDNLEMAPLPAWLQAMRPVESAAPSGEESVNDQRVEKSGPLAGLRGVLRSEDLVAQYQKLPSYSVKLRVSEPQTLKAGLLEQVISGESKPQAASSESIFAPQLLVRIATGLALIALILIVIFFGLRPLTPLALSQVDPQVSAINRLVEGLAPGSPVLIGVDYQGGLSGEMRIAAQPVIQHLLSRGARLIFISTQPEGPALAESLFSAARLASKSAYPVELKANLGYLMGGSTALKALATSPLQLSIPQPWTAGGWSQIALVNLKQITDFSQVILLTDTPESARDWVEQVQPELAKKNEPLIVISSAQATPLLRPYQESGQITALLSGLLGGAAYEQIRQVSGSGTSYWNAYLAGILALVLFILMGGIVSLISNLSHSKTKRKV